MAKNILVQMEYVAQLIKDILMVKDFLSLV